MPLLRTSLLIFGFLAVASLGLAENQAAEAKTIPSVDGGAGQCSVDFTVRDSAGKPVYGANIRVHIAYGFMGLHKLDLEVGTNADGKARFQGLPSKVKDVLFFRASKGDLTGSASYDPAQECTAKHDIVLEKATQ
jgi:hypothetical protein